MLMPEEEETFKELPYYKSILKCFLRKQIGTLIEELAAETGEESVILMANTSAGTTSCLSSNNAKNFIEAHTDIETRFLSFCLGGCPTASSRNIRTPKSGKRKPRNEARNARTQKQAKHSSSSSPSVSTVDETASESVKSDDIDTIPSKAASGQSEGMQSQPPSLVLGVYPESEETGKTMTTTTHNSSKSSEHFDGVNIKVEPLADETINDFTIIKTEPQSHEETEGPQLNESSDLNYLSGLPSDSSLDNSMTSSPAGMPTFGPIRFVRKFPPKERTTLSLPEKIQIIQDYEAGGTTSQRKLADKYNISKSAVADMIKNRQLLKEHYEFNANTKRKRFNTNSKFADINEVVWQWFRTARENGIQMSGPMIQEKALQVAQELNVKEFKGSNGWLHSWKSRYNITSYRDDMNGSQRQTYINDYSKVEGFNAAAGQNSEAASAIMNLGSLANLFSTSSSDLQSSSACASLQQGSSDLSNSGSTFTDSQPSQNVIAQSDGSVKDKHSARNKECMDTSSTTSESMSENSTKIPHSQTLSSSSSLETMAQTATYEKIVESAVLEFEQQNSCT